MAGIQGQSSFSILIDGNYRGVNNWYSSLVVDAKGSRACTKESSGGSRDVILEFGDFGEADPEIVKNTGQKVYNMKFNFIDIGMNWTEFGVVSEDGLQVTIKGIMGISKLEWMTEEEADALEAYGEPIDAPTCPYKIQPENLGKFLWITGAPGLGKSTSAQLLSRTAGYVYYEADCFGSCKNPYIPPDVPDPSMAQVNQTPLKGEGFQERVEVYKIWEGEFRKLLAGADHDEEKLKKFYGMMCEDINRERRRIGGDWVVAAVTLGRDMRDFMRSILGPDLVFVLLEMSQEDVKERVLTRHKGDEVIAKMMMSINKFCGACPEDEENAVNVMITKDMSREEVVTKILEMTK